MLPQPPSALPTAGAAAPAATPPFNHAPRQACLLGALAACLPGNQRHFFMPNIVDVRAGAGQFTAGHGYRRDLLTRRTYLSPASPPIASCPAGRRRHALCVPSAYSPPWTCKTIPYIANHCLKHHCWTLGITPRSLPSSPALTLPLPFLPYGTAPACHTPTCTHTYAPSFLTAQPHLLPTYPQYKQTTLPRSIAYGRRRTTASSLPI